MEGAKLSHAKCLKLFDVFFFSAMEAVLLTSVHETFVPGLIAAGISESSMRDIRNVGISVTLR
jgi:hypothetical protein